MAKDPAVLIVDENDDSRVELRKLLTRGGLTVAGEARYGAAAATAAHEFHPDAIVVGIEEPPNRALQTIESLAHLFLETPILGYSSLDEAGAMRRAIRAGVRDYLIRPLSADTLREAVYSSLEQEERRQLRRAGQVVPTARGSVITVTGAKGGVGKSSVAINLALALRKVTGRSVALVDADTHFGDVATMLNVPREDPVTRVLQSVEQLDRGSVVERATEHSSGVHVLPGPVMPEEWETIAIERVEHLVNLLSEAFDFVVIDTPDVFDPVVQQCVMNSTLTLLVTSMDMSSLADTRAALRTLQRWDCPPEKVRLTVNPTRQKNGLRYSDVQQAVNWPVFWVIPFEKKVPDAAQLGESLIQTAPKSTFSRNLYDLAGVISGNVTMTTNGHRAGAVRRLFGWLPVTATSG